ncbi:hypothetical protein [Flectobacillus sp. BAB-3569]
MGFYKGNELQDPYNMLKGSGKVHRYVEIKSGEELKSKALSMLVDEAILA